MKRIIFSLLVVTFSISQILAQFNPKSHVENPKTFKDKTYNFFMSKRLDNSTSQRDSLYDLNVAFNKDTTERGKQYRSLQTDYRDLNNRFVDLSEKHKELQDDYTEMNDRYTDLIKSSLSKTEQLNLALKLKSEELAAREKRLEELEAKIRRQDSVTKAINDLVKKALLSFNSDELTVEMKNGKIYVSMSDKLLFRSGSAEVEEKGKEALKKLADVLNKNADIEIAIEGHTDNIPIKTSTFQDNWELSTDRATNIVRLLSDLHKVNPKRLTAAGRGEFMPKASNDTPEGRAKNRRTEIILSPKLDELYKLFDK